MINYRSYGAYTINRTDPAGSRTSICIHYRGRDVSLSTIQTPNLTIDISPERLQKSVSFNCTFREIFVGRKADAGTCALHKPSYGPA